MSAARERCDGILVAVMAHLSAYDGPASIDISKFERVDGVVTATIDAPTGDSYRVSVEYVGNHLRQAA